MTTHASPDSSESLHNTVASGATSSTHENAATSPPQRPALAPQSTAASTSPTRRLRWPWWLRVLVYLSPVLGVVLAMLALILQIIQVVVQ